MKLTKITPCLKDQPFLTLKRMMYAATSTPMLCTRSPRACTNAALTARLLCPWPLLRAALGEFDWGTWEWRWEWEWEWRCPDWFSKKPILKLEREKCSKKWAWELCGCFFCDLVLFLIQNKMKEASFPLLFYEEEEVQQNHTPWESYRPLMNEELIQKYIYEHQWREREILH